MNEGINGRRKKEEEGRRRKKKEEERRKRKRGGGLGIALNVVQSSVRSSEVCITIRDFGGWVCGAASL